MIRGRDSWNSRTTPNVSPKVRPRLLVLVRWHGDIVAVYDAVPSDAAPLMMCDGVGLEVYDVSAERAEQRLTPRVDLRPIAGFFASAGLHVLVACLAFAAMTVRSPDAIAADEMNDRGASVSDNITRIAANENASERLHDERPPVPVDEEAVPEPPAEQASAEVAAHGSAGADTESTSPTSCTPPRADANPGKKCRRNVVITSLETRPGCFVDTVGKTGQSGTLTFPCEGDGEATLSFGSRAFTGAKAAGKIDVCTGTEYPFGDGCKWTSAQRVSGSISGGTLQFTYGEAPKAGQEHCATACEALGTVRIEGDSWRHTVK